MFLDENVRKQVKPYLDLIEQDIILKLDGDETAKSTKILDFIKELASLSEKITIEYGKLERCPSFSVERADFVPGIEFASLPLGHELNSFILAMVQVSGRPPKIGQKIISCIKEIKQPLRFETFVSLTCTNCPEVVQALNIMSLINPNISHLMVDGGLFQKEVAEKGILALPTTYCNGQEFSIGQASIDELLQKISTLS